MGTGCRPSCAARRERPFDRADAGGIRLASDAGEKPRPGDVARATDRRHRTCRTAGVRALNRRPDVAAAQETRKKSGRSENPAHGPRAWLSPGRLRTRLAFVMPGL